MNRTQIFSTLLKDRAGMSVEFNHDEHDDGTEYVRIDFASNDEPLGGYIEIMLHKTGVDINAYDGAGDVLSTQGHHYADFKPEAQSDAQETLE